MTPSADGAHPALDGDEDAFAVFQRQAQGVARDLGDFALAVDGDALRPREGGGEGRVLAGLGLVHIGEHVGAAVALFFREAAAQHRRGGQHSGLIFLVDLHKPQLGPGGVGVGPVKEHRPVVFIVAVDVRKGGKLAITAGAGPMGLGALTYALHRDVTPSMIVVTDINDDRLARAEELFPPKEVKEETGIELHFVNTGKIDDPVAYLRELSGGTGFDDVLCYAPVPAVIEQSSAILGRDGCLNFFAGPTDPAFSAKINFYDVHYNSAHVMGTTGGNTADMIESLELTAAKRIDPAVMVTHIGGLDSVAETTLNLPKIPGGKKLIYTHLEMPLVALTDLRETGKNLGDERYIELADIVDAHKGLWCPDAEEYLLANFVK